MGSEVEAVQASMGGLLAGRYRRADVTGVAPGDGTRKAFNVTALGTVTERNLDIVDVLKEVAAEAGCTPAQAGLAWLLRNPDVTAPIVGARTPAQLEDNLAALAVELTAAQVARLDDVSAIEPGHPHALLAGDHIRNVMRGGMKI